MFRGYPRPTLRRGLDGPGGSQAQRPALPFRWPEGRSPPKHQELAPARGHGGAHKVSIETDTDRVGELRFTGVIELGTSRQVANRQGPQPLRFLRGSLLSRCRLLCGPGSGLRT